MSLVNKAIESLFNGVSQQPAQLRLSSQAEMSDNYYPTIATGLNKRPPTVFKAKLSDSTDHTAYTQLINRDLAERYVLIVRNNLLEVYDAFTGEQKTVSSPSGYSYLSSANPASDFSSVTLADYTILVNKTKKVAYTYAKTAPKMDVAYVIFSYSGAGVSRTLSITVNGYSASYTGSSSNISTIIETVVGSLAMSLGSDFSVTTPFTNTVKIERTSSTVSPWTITVGDTYGNSTMRVVKGAVQLFSDLPAQCDDGYVCYVTSRPEDLGSGYYVRYSAQDKSYIECPAPDSFTSLDPLTMPHKLVRNSDGSFTFSPLEWAPRTVGDYASNPWPTFVGRTITETFFFRNRLGFLSDENVILSTAGDYFNLFAKTAVTVTDSDPIDEAVATTKVSILRFAVPFNKSLLLFSDQTQFQLTASEVLAPRTVKAEPVTEFVSSNLCRPIGAGRQLFFASATPNSTRFREYFVQQDTYTNDAADITAHVPSYVPSGVFKMAVSTTEDTLMALTSNEGNAIYVYKYYWGADEKVQSAWFKFSFSPGDHVMGAEFVGSVAYFVIARSDGIYLEEMGLQAAAVDEGMPFQVLLDRKVWDTGTYNPATNRTSWTLPWAPSGSVQVVLGQSFGNRKGSTYTLTIGAGNVVSISGDLSAGPVAIGVPYKATYRFSEQYVKDAKGNPVASAVLKIRRMLLTYANSGYFRVEVTPHGRDTSSYTFTGKTLGGLGSTLGSPEMTGGSFRFPVLSSSKNVTIDLINDSPFPCAFQSAEWEGEMVVQSQRI